MDELKFTLFGGVEIVRAGQPVTGFVSAKALALLCYLVVSGRTHLRSILQGLLWGEAPETAAQNSLRNVLSNLRKLTGDYLVITRQTAAFNQASPVWLDVKTFQECAGAGAADGRLTPDDVSALETAVSLYSGEFMQGFSLDDAPDFEAWLLAQRERLRLLCLQSLYRLALYHTAAGQQEAAMAMHGRLLTLEPWREETHRELMRLLARSGRWSEALAQYQTCKELLGRDLGVLPMPETTSLYERIKTARDAPRHNLPPHLPPLVGREAELAELAAMLRQPDCRLLTLTGPGGVGKTRLGQQLALRLAGDYLNGVRFVALTAVPAPDFLATAVAAALGLSLKPQPAPREQLLDCLRQQEQLLLLDNFDHLLAGGDLLDAILKNAPDVKLVVTSRQRLDLRQEWLFALDGLPYPPDETAPEAIGNFPAVQLFAQLARHARHDFALTDEAAGAARICRLLAGLPLGLELAAAQVTHLACARIGAVIERNLDALAVSWRNAPARHRSLRAVFDQSWPRLAPEEQAVFRRLAVFRGDFSLAAGTAVAGLTPAILTALVAKSFLRPVGDGRYDAHEILRQYAAERLAANPAEQQAAVPAHTRFFAALMAQQENRFTTALAEVTAVLKPEISHIRAAWQTAVAGQDWDNVAAMMGSLHRFYEAQSWFQEGSDLFQQALTVLADAAEPPRQSVRGRLLAHTAGLLSRLGQITLSEEMAAESVRLLRAQGDRPGVALATNILGITQIYAGAFAEAERTIQSCIDLYRQLGERAEIVRPLANLGSVCARQGKYEASMAALQAGLAVCREIGDRRGEALFLNNIAANFLMRHQKQPARPYLEACLPICDEIGFDQVKLVALYNLGEIHLEEGDLAGTQTVCQQAVAIARRLNDRPNLARALKMVGLAQTRLGDHVSAWAALREGLDVAQETGAIPAVIDVLHGVADWQIAAGQQPEAAALLRLIAAHPAAESQHRDRARERLAELGPAFPETGADEERPLDEVVRRLLYHPHRRQ